MHFMHRNNAWYNFAVRVKPLYRYLLTLAAFAFCIVSWFTLYSSLETSLEHQQRAISTAKQQLLFLSRATAESEKLTQTLQNLTDQFGTHVRAFAQVSASPLLNIAQNAKGAHLTLATCVAGEDQNKEWYTKRNISFNGAGTLQNVDAFFENLNKSPSLVRCTRMQMQHVAGENYSIACSFNAYQELK